MAPSGKPGDFSKRIQEIQLEHQNFKKPLGAQSCLSQGKLVHHRCINKRVRSNAKRQQHLNKKQYDRMVI